MQNNDSALPVTTTSKEIEAVNSLTVFSEIENTAHKHVSNNIANHDGGNTITEVVMVASVDTQITDIKGMLVYMVGIWVYNE